MLHTIKFVIHILIKNCNEAQQSSYYQIMLQVFSSILDCRLSTYDCIHVKYGKIIIQFTYDCHLIFHSLGTDQMSIKLSGKLNTENHTLD